MPWSKKIQYNLLTVESPFGRLGTGCNSFKLTAKVPLNILWNFVKILKKTERFRDKAYLAFLRPPYFQNKCLVSNNFKNKIFIFGQIGNIWCQNFVFCCGERTRKLATQDARVGKEKSITWKHKELIPEKCIFSNTEQCEAFLHVLACFAEDSLAQQQSLAELGPHGQTAKLHLLEPDKQMHSCP